VLEDTLSKMLKEPATVLGCGRTDAQVHATQYFFHLDTVKEWKTATELEEMVFRLNKTLPTDIAVFDILPVDGNAHAQYDAKQRTYDYFIHTKKDPFLITTSSYYQKNNLQIDKMKAAADLLVKYEDYRSFCKSPDQYSHTLCRISSSRLGADSEGEKLRFKITSNRFLRGMIRAITARLIKIGSGEMSVAEFEQLLITKETPSQLDFAHPQGLYLSHVTYPFLDIKPRNSFVPSPKHLTDYTYL
jgi:tRNA pseudouridine38-40 synthase